MLRFCFDVDGVMLDFEGSYLRAIIHYFQLDLPEDYRSDCWSFSDMLTETQMQEGWDYFIESEHFSRLSPLIDSERFNAVFGAYPVHFITNIPPQYSEQRKTNLRDVGFRFNSLHCGGFMSFDDRPPVTKAEIIQQLVNEHESLLFVDDHPDNCLNVLEQFPQAVVWLMARSFNRDFTHPQIRRAEHWNDILEFAEQWIQAHAPKR